MFFTIGNLNKLLFIAEFIKHVNQNKTQ